MQFYIIYTLSVVIDIVFLLVIYGDFFKKSDHELQVIGLMVSIFTPILNTFIAAYMLWVAAYGMFGGDR